MKTYPPQETSEPSKTLVRLAPATLREPAADYLNAGDYGSFLFVCERRARWAVLQLIAVCDLASRSQLAELFHFVWIDCERLPSESDLASLIGRVSPASPKAFTPDDVLAFDALPDPFTAYRGCVLTRRKRCGRSWTLSLDCARWFADRYVEVCGEGNVGVLSRSIAKSNVLFYTNQRNEQEVVLIDSSQTRQRQTGTPGALVQVDQKAPSGSSRRLPPVRGYAHGKVTERVISRKR
jgi:hypothetical protein